MTGYGAADGALGSGRVAVELRSVNHRFFNATIKLPVELSRWEGEVRETLRQRISRGHVTLTARLDRGVSGPLLLDRDRFSAYLALLRELKEEYSFDGEVDIATVLGMPDVMSRVNDVQEDDVKGLVSLVQGALDSLTNSREDEGARLKNYIGEHLCLVESALARISERAPARLVEHRERLRESLRQLAQTISVDEQRLAMEMVIQADRLDIQEELSRFRSHIAAFRGSLESKGDEPVGKRLGFLLQEMLREANTTGAKANDAAILAEVVTVKEELERIREQVENLE